MYWKKRFDREDADSEIKADMLQIREKHKNYGYHRPMKKTLRNHDFVVNKKEIQWLMREWDFRVTAFTRISRKYSSYKENIGKVAPNLVNRRFDSSILHQKMTTDTTEFKYHETDKSGNIQIKKVYLEFFLDIFNREIVSFSLSKQPNG